MLKGMVRVVCGLGVVALVLTLCVGDASARPNFVGAFKKAYPAVKGIDEAKCGACHIGKPADKKWNDYGNAMKKAAGKEKANDEEATKAMKDIEKEKSGTEGKTFGDLLKDGKLPGKG